METNAIILKRFGRTLCCPPIVNSPKGKPQATRTVRIAMTENIIAAIIASIFSRPPIDSGVVFNIEIISHSNNLNEK